MISYRQRQTSSDRRTQSYGALATGIVGLPKEEKEKEITQSYLMEDSHV